MPKDQVEAVKWYRKAAEQGHASAQINLGVCYVNGDGVEKDQVEAVKWYRKAAEQGDESALIKLGICYEKGSGVVKNVAESYAYYNNAAITSENARLYRDGLISHMTTLELEAGRLRSGELYKAIEAARAKKAENNTK